MDKNAPLPPPDWIRKELPRFYQSVQLAAAGQRSEARKMLETFPEAETRAWCVEHGHIAGRFRFRLLGMPPASSKAGAVGPRSAPTSLIESVLHRDAYHCRYCLLPVVSRAVFDAFAAVVGKDAFPFGRRNENRHGAALVSWAQTDHVMPYPRGGLTDLSNLVTACWTCNYGKGSYEVTQIGITDPRLRKPVESDWDGLTSLLDPLRAVASALGSG